MQAVDQEYLKAQLSSPPFVAIDGVHNVRSLGGYESKSTSGHITKMNFAFRSGGLSGITAKGKEQLKELGIKKIFDLRSDIETVKFGRPPPALGAQVELERIPVFKDQDYSPENLTLRSKLYKSEDVQDLMIVYNDILIGGIHAFGAIFKHIRDYPNVPFLFHCTAGKDRTGVLAALFLKIAGVDDVSIMKDYALTRVGSEPTKAVTIAKLIVLDDFVGDMAGLLRSLDTRPESMLAFLTMLESKYGGVEGYLQNQLGFSDADVVGIKKNILELVADK
ncbi:protein-tyrosine phosphatase-like protein [Hysterangium stoloniferum]|nr:protein-tyrosine phosphatase-like protein [Hysterangium stoloniferum]